MEGANFNIPLEIKEIYRDVPKNDAKLSGDTREQSGKQFPLLIRDVSPEDHEQLSHVYRGFHHEFVRVGPKGYIVPKKYEIYGADIYNTPLRPTDVFVTSYQRSGTTLTQELVWLLANDMDYDTAKRILLKQRYSFLERNFFINTKVRDMYLQSCDGSEKTQTLLSIFLEPATKVLAGTPDPRFIKSHLPMSLLPPSLLDTAKMVYMVRDPRDVAVSCYHRLNLLEREECIIEFEQFWNLFHKNLLFLTPYFEHVKEAWAKRDHPNMLILFYEELLKDMPASIRRVADFLGRKVTVDDVTGLCDHFHISNFKHNKSVNNDDIREAGISLPYGELIRKGKSGGWRDHFDEEMSLQAERWIADNLRDTDLRFPSVEEHKF